MHACVRVCVCVCVCVSVRACGALIEPTDTTVPVRLLNTKASPVTVYEGSTLATLEEVDADSVGPPGQVNSLETMDHDDGVLKQEQ